MHESVILYFRLVYACNIICPCWCPCFSAICFAGTLNLWPLAKPKAGFFLLLFSSCSFWIYLLFFIYGKLQLALLPCRPVGFSAHC